MNKKYYYLILIDDALKIVSNSKPNPDNYKYYSEEGLANAASKSNAEFQLWLMACDKFDIADKENELKFNQHIADRIVSRGDVYKSPLTVSEQIRNGILIPAENIKIECTNCQMSLQNHSIIVGCQKTKTPNYLVYFVSPALSDNLNIVLDNKKEIDTNIGHATPQGGAQETEDELWNLIWRGYKMSCHLECKCHAECNWADKKTEESKQYFTITRNNKQI